MRKYPTVSYRYYEDYFFRSKEVGKRKNFLRRYGSVCFEITNGCLFSIDYRLAKATSCFMGLPHNLPGIPGTIASKGFYIPFESFFSNTIEDLFNY